MSRLIDADALWMDVIHSMDYCDDILEFIERQPTIEPEPKKGKWMSHYEYCKKHKLLPSGLVAFWWCDQCEQAVEHSTNFCPTCGADMRGEQDDESRSNSNAQTDTRARSMGTTDKSSGIWERREE